MKPTVSPTDQSYASVQGLDAEGKFSSLSAVMQHGLPLVEREVAERGARLEAIRAIWSGRQDGRRSP